MKLERKRGFYEKYIKRILDIICSLLAIVIFCWLYVIIAIFVRIKLGSPVLFKQPRPGLIDPRTGHEKIFNMYKFRTMTDQRGPDGELLPDDVRLTKFGAWLRSTSLDEIPEAFCILKGDMSVIGPRPQLVRDMVFMSDEQRMRHTAKPGLSGLAQVNGRNAIDWEKKLNYDLEYIKDISFLGDLRLVMQTFFKFLRQDGINEEGSVTATDYGDYLLNKSLVSRDYYDAKQAESKLILSKIQG